jgi:hypothetical protein
MRFSIHFDANSEEFNQLVQTGYLNLAGHPTFQPPQPPFIPPVQPNDLRPHPSITTFLISLMYKSNLQSMMVGMIHQSILHLVLVTGQLCLYLFLLHLLYYQFN